MEIVLIVVGVLALALLATLTLRRRGSRGGRKRASQQWRGSSASTLRAKRSRPAAATAAYVSVGATAGGVAVQDPPRTEEADLDAWDDDLEWNDDLDAAPEPVAAEPPAAGGNGWGATTWDEPPAREPEPEPETWEEPAPEAAAATPAAEPVEEPDAFQWPAPAEPAWDDDLHDAETVPVARADGDGQPIPSARGAAAFGAATATPAVASRRKRGGVLRTPVVLVALYAAAGIALVVLAVSLLTETMSPSETKKPERASQTQTPAPSATPEATGPTAAEKAAAAKAARERRQAFQRTLDAAVASELRDQRRARAAAAKKRRDAARKRRADAAKAAPEPSTTPRQNYTPSTPAPAPPSSGGGGGGGGSGGGGGGCEFCIG